MDSYSALKALPQLLLPWFADNQRDLPWRQDRDPYHIWLSEIMLQQTRVEAVKGYYARFLSQIPDIASLAKADDQQLHKLWEGLGYYSRVRNLKKAAQQIMVEHQGVFPGEYRQILQLPGIGEYTAGAICSIAFNQKTPAVDGNVLRVYSRLTNDPTPIDLPQMKKKVTQALQSIYPDAAGDFTQALMELGATLCGPNRKALCQQCPCADICKAYACGCADQLPVRLPKAPRRVENMTVFLLRCGQRYALRKRPETGLLASLWEFPNVPEHLDTQGVLGALTSMSLTPVQIHWQVEKSHIFTHIQWNMRGFFLDVQSENPEFSWFSPEQIARDVALPTAFRMFWDDLIAQRD